MTSAPCGRNQTSRIQLPLAFSGQLSEHTASGVILVKNLSANYLVDSRRLLLIKPPFRSRHEFSLSGNGARNPSPFLVIKDSAAGEQASTATPASMVVVLNRLEELKARTGTQGL